jgi:hypothetical protein
MITGKSKQTLTDKARHVPRLVASIVEEPLLSPQSVRQVTEILDRVENELADIRARLLVSGAPSEPSSSDLQRYFPVRETPRRDVSPTKLEEARAQWEQALVRGRGYRQEALEQIGPLWDRDQVAQHLGVSIPTIHSRRKRGELLAVSFDKYRYSFPAWQFVGSPVEGDTGVVRHFDEILRLLGDLPSWEKARFFVTETPPLGGRRPIDILRKGTPAQNDEVRKVAPHVGELGF